MPKKPFSQLSEQEKQKILKVLWRLFARHGYASTSIKMITRQLKVADGYLYYYFHGKEDLVRWMIDHGVALWREHHERKLNEQQPEGLFDLFKLSLVATADLIKKNPDLYGAYFQFINDPRFPLAEHLAQRIAWIEGAYEAAVKKEIAAGRLRRDVSPAMAAMLLDVVINRVWESLYNPKIDPMGVSDMTDDQLAGLADQLASVLRDGLAGSSLP